MAELTGKIEVPKFNKADVIQLKDVREKYAAENSDEFQDWIDKLISKGERDVGDLGRSIKDEG